MAVIHEDGRVTLIEVLDRVLDKGIVIDAWVRLSLAGMDLLTLEARIVMASLETYLGSAGALRLSSLVAAPPMGDSRKTDDVREKRASAYRSS